MRKIVGSMVLLVGAAVVAADQVMMVQRPRDPSDYTSMRSREVEAFQDVAHKCQRDVEYYCDDSPFWGGEGGKGGRTATESSLHLPFLMFRASAAATPSWEEQQDPFVELGRLMDSFLALSTTTIDQEASSRWILVNDKESSEVSLPHEDASTVQVLSSHMAAYTDPETMEEASQQVQQRAQFVLEHPEATETQRRLARRLQAVTTPEALLEQRRIFLPFGCPRRNRCLQQVYEQRLVSPPCGLALQRLEHVRAVQHVESIQRYHEQQFVLRHLLLLYVLVLATMAVLYCRRSPQVRQTRRLKRRILTAIYSQPALKAAVERELGESLGVVPPLRWRALMRFGLHGQEYRAWSQAARRIWFGMVTVSAMLLFLWPTLFLPLCVGMAATLLLCAVSTDPPVRVCACCCCGASTEDVKKGNLTQDQECCNCCKGTGICAPSCASCCGNDTKGCDCCCCCGDGCCCSSSRKSGEGCCCGCCSNGGCCCTAAQTNIKACSCCSGSGCCCCSAAVAKACSGGCCCCCGGSCSVSKGVQTTEGPQGVKLCIYEGIPVQVV